MHSLLKRQLKKIFGDSFDVPNQWRGFIDMVNNAYHESDMDRNMLERSLELSSQELLQANSEMRVVFEAVPDIFLRIDASGKILDCKTGDSSNLLVSRQEIIGSKIYDIPLITVANKFRTAMEDVKRTNAVVSFEYSLLLNGTENFYEARWIPLLDEQGVVIIRNITDRKNAENALKKSEEYYREITLNASDVLFILDAKGFITYASPSAERFTGYHPDELMGKHSLFLIIPDDHSRASEDFLKALTTKEISIPNSFRIRHKDGREVIIEGVGKNLLQHPTIAGFVMNVRDVTDRKRAEEALRESEKKYRLLTEGISDIVWIADINLRELYVSPSIRKVLGFSQEARLSQTIDQQMTPDSLSLAMENLARELALEEQGDSDPKRNVTLVLEYYHKDGSIRWIETTISGLRNEQGALTGLHGVSRDITERKKAQDALQESEQNYRRLASFYERLNNISIAFAESSSTEGVFNSIAESLRLLTGGIAATFSVYYPRTRDLQLVSLTIDPEASHKVSPFFGPDLFAMHMPVSADAMKSMIDQVIARPGDLHELSFGVISREISDIVMEAFGCRQIIALAVNYAGEMLGTCAAYLPGNQPAVPDDTLKTFAYLSGMAVNRRHAEDALLASEERYRTIFENTATANIIIAEDTTILMANNNFARLSGYTKQELEGKISWTVVIHKDDVERMKTYHKMRRIDPRSAPHSYEFRFISRKGEVRYIIIQVAVIPETKESIASLIDLTESKQLETQLIQSQKMESVGRLAGGVAHDFNNMLSVIIGNTEMAMKRVEHADPLYHTLQDVLNAGMRSADLTHQLLAFARKQTVSPKVLDLNDTVTGMLKMLQRLIGEHIDLGWHPGHDLWKVKIDPSQVDQLLANLMVNARDAIEKTGRIVIETSNAKCNAAYCIDRPEWIPGDYVVLAVSDDGCGMEKETITNIFEPFFTTKKEGQGTGLGLATVYGIVKQNNGFINVYSEPGQGTTFKIFLPRYMDEIVETADEESEPELPGGTETILVVEDSVTVLKLCKAMLETLGYQVLAANGKDEALKLAGEYSVKIDLLLTDVVMPDMNGKELSERIVAINPGLKCLYMSGYTADVIARQGVLDEGIKFISKPFSLRDLAEKVREVIGS